MYRVIRSGELQPSPGGTITFEGEPYGSGVSCFLVNNEPGAGARPAQASVLRDLGRPLREGAADR
jgi:hypothetical protein